MSIEVIIIIVLSGLLIAATVERVFYQRYMNGELSKAMNRIMSKNITEYVQATKEEKKDPEKEKFTETDEVLQTEASDEEFARHIEAQTK